MDHSFSKYKKWACTGGKILLFCGATYVVLASAFSIFAETQYRESMELVNQEEYEDARERIEFLSQIDYKDSGLIMKYCDSRIAYAQGDVHEANRLIGRYLYELEELFPDAKAYGEKVYKENFDAWSKQWAAEHPEYSALIPTNIYDAPCIRMSEDWVSRTKLGRPASVYQYISGSTMYRFESEGRTIFEAWCDNGRVTDIFDYRNAPVPEPEPVYVPTYREPDPDDDPYDAKDYSNEFDFYDDNKDNFIDFYAAERYFKKHHD